MKPATSVLLRRLKPIIEGAEEISRFNLAFVGIEGELAALEKLAPGIANKAVLVGNQNHRRQFIRAFKDIATVDLSNIAKPDLVVGRRNKIEAALAKRNVPGALAIPANLIDVGVPKTLAIAIEQNAALIKTIPSQYMYKVRHFFDLVMQGQAESENLKRSLSSIEAISERRAKLIARDQMQKLVSSLNQARQQSVGITGYIWRTSNDERVRDSHKDNDGDHFNWNAPPAETGHPGEDIQCRCTAEPDLTTVLPSYLRLFTEG